MYSNFYNGMLRITIFGLSLLGSGLAFDGDLPEAPDNSALGKVTSKAEAPAAVAAYLQQQGFSESNPLYPHLLHSLQFYVGISEEDGTAAFSEKYYGFAFAHLTNIKALIADVASQPEAYQNAWLRWFGERMVGYRIAYDIPAMHAFMQTIPAGDVKENPTVGDLQTWLDTAAGSLSSQEQAKVATALAAINPDVFPEGMYRGDISGDPRWVISDGDWNHAFRLRSNAAVLFPDPAWAQTALQTTTLDVIAEDLIEPATHHKYYTLKGAGIGDVVLRLDMVGDTVASAVATVPSVHNRQYPVIPLSFREKDGAVSKPDDTFDSMWLTVEGDRILGCARILYSLAKQNNKVHTLKLDLPLTADSEGGKGTYILRQPDRKGRNLIVAESMLAEYTEAPTSSMTAPIASWTTLFGSDGTSSETGQAGEAWVENFEDAGLAWVSDMVIPTTRGPNTRGNANPIEPGMPLSGGWASPMVENGVLYLPYFKPSGDDFSYGAGRNAKNPDPLQASRWDMMRINTDEYLHAFDAATGKTLYQLRLPGRGVNWMSFNKGGPGSSAGVHDGVVVWVGSLGEVYAAKDGKLQWVHNIGLRYEMMKEARRELIATEQLYGSRNDFQSHVIVTDGVAVVSDQKRTKTDYRYERECGLIGFDVATGRMLWHLPEVAGSGRFTQSGQLWNFQGKNYILASNHKAAFVIEPKTGKIVAHQTGFTNRTMGFTVGPDVIIGENITENGYPFTAYRFDPSKPPEQALTQVWQLDGKYSGRDGAGVYLDGIFFLPSYKSKVLLRVDAKTGQVLSEEPAPINGGEHSPFYVTNGAYVDGCKDRTNGLLIFNADGEKFVGSTEAYGVTLGTGYCGSVVPALTNDRMYLRTPDRIIALDLRESHKPTRSHADRWSHVRNAKELSEKEAAEAEKRAIEKAKQDKIKAEENKKRAAEEKKKAEAAKRKADQKKADEADLEDFFSEEEDGGAMDMLDL